MGELVQSLVLTCDGLGHRSGWYAQNVFCSSVNETCSKLFSGFNSSLGRGFVTLSLEGVAGQGAPIATHLDKSINSLVGSFSLGGIFRNSS